MKIHTLHSEQWLPRDRDEVFAFFARPENLEQLTPDWLKFQIRTPGPLDMKEGLQIDYRIRLHGLPLRWRSEIIRYDPPHSFVDVQRQGPYRLWDHTHTFSEQDGGTLVTDDVAYALNFGGPLHRWLVAPDLRRIFAHRSLVLAQSFDAGPARLRLSIDGPEPAGRAAAQTG